jgi:hypothetical protein
MKGREAVYNVRTASPWCQSAGASLRKQAFLRTFAWLLGAQLLSRAVGVEHFHSVIERGPEILKSAIKDVFKRVTVGRI